MTDTDIRVDFTAWLVGPHTGISSLAIVAQLTGHETGRAAWRSDYPHDPDDFTRCARLLARYPEAEVPGFLDGAWGPVPRTYALMRSIIDDAEATA